MRTVSSKHAELTGKTVMLKGFRATITDTTETASGNIHVAVRAHAMMAAHIEGQWWPLGAILQEVA